MMRSYASYFIYIYIIYTHIYIALCVVDDGTGVDYGVSKTYEDNGFEW